MLHTIKNSRKELQLQHQILENEKSRFQLAIDGTEDGLWDWDLRSNNLFKSDRFETMLGYEIGELPNTVEAWSDLLHPKDKDIAFKKVKEYFDSQGKSNYESTFRMKSKSGEWKWITGRGKALFDESGTPLRFIGFNTDVTERVNYEKKIEHSAKHDSLTDLPNRFLFNETILTVMARTKRHREYLAILYIDLDGFKEVNDTYGHKAGDHVLVIEAERMKKVFREEDIIARLGGDEFVIAVSDLKRQSDVISLLDRFLKTVEEVVPYRDEKGEHQLSVSASIGVTFYPQDKDIGSDALLRQADQAMYDAKSLGKSQYQFFNLEENQLLASRRECVRKLSKAIAEDQLELYYQPKVEIKSSQVVGFEALLRWNHPEKGLIFPDSFLPEISLERELIIELGKWVFKAVFKQLTIWQKSGFYTNVSINMTAHEFNSKGILEFLSNLLTLNPNIKPQNIEIEILETNALDNPAQAKKMIEMFQRIGFKVSLDDFGTGYSTLSYLKDLPVDVLKIDKSFIFDMLSDKATLSIVEAAIGLAKAFNCRVVAEGVETIEHGVVLSSLGCDIAQGYVIAKPIKSDEVLSWSEEFQMIEEWCLAH
jgi:diguanylate cyclase (GGDEF)-like protein/PAS domain S-box-containing protein